MIQVLIVDDDKLACVGLRSIMPWDKYGMQVIGDAANGQKALEFLEKNHVDLMIVDLSMPVMDGLQLIRECRERYQELHYVVMTFHEDFEHVQTALRLGVLDYISKLKIEAEDCDAICQRILQKLNNAQSAPRASSASRSITALFDSPLWLYDDMCMDTLAQTINHSRIHPRDIEVAITEAIVRIENLVGLPKQAVPQIEDAQSAVMFLYEYRRKAVNESKSGIDNTEARILTVAGYINMHFSEPLHAESVASIVNLSRSYMSICFKKSLGITFNEFIRRKRVYEAKKLLRETTIPINTIANRVGYENYKHFKDVFYELTKQTPHTYRETNVPQ